MLAVIVVAAFPLTAGGQNSSTFNEEWRRALLAYRQADFIAAYDTIHPLTKSGSGIADPVERFRFLVHAAQISCMGGAHREAQSLARSGLDVAKALTADQRARLDSWWVVLGLTDIADLSYVDFNRGQGVEMGDVYLGSGELFDANGNNRIDVGAFGDVDHTVVPGESLPIPDGTRVTRADPGRKGLNDTGQRSDRCGAGPSLWRVPATLSPSTKRRVQVSVRCPAAVQCTGTLHLLLEDKRRSAREGRSVSVASTRYAIDSAKTRTITLTLRKGAQRILQQGRTINGVVSAEFRGQGGPAWKRVRVQTRDS